MLTPGLGDYGFGWWIMQMPVGRAARPHRTILHPGEGDGFDTLVLRLPDDRVTVIFINNEGKTYLHGIAQGLLDVVFGEAPRMTVTPLLQHRLEAEGAQAASAWFRGMRADRPEDYLVDEQELNTMGYALIAQGRAQDAVQVLTLMTEAFPASANGFDSLADAYALAGDRAEALAHYRRALEIDPGFSHPAEMIGKLESD